MKKKIKWLLAFILLVLFSNMSIGHLIFLFYVEGLNFKGGNYLYGSGSELFFGNDRYFSPAPIDSLDFLELSDHGYHDAVQRFAAYQEENPQDTSTLYRHFKRNPLKFWMWGEYLTCNCYRLPYKAEIPKDYFTERYSNITTKKEDAEQERKQQEDFERMQAENDSLAKIEKNANRP